MPVNIIGREILHTNATGTNEVIGPEEIHELIELGEKIVIYGQMDDDILDTVKVVEEQVHGTKCPYIYGERDFICPSRFCALKRLSKAGLLLINWTTRQRLSTIPRWRSHWAKPHYDELRKWGSQYENTGLSPSSQSAQDYTTDDDMSSDVDNWGYSSWV